MGAFHLQTGDMLAESPPGAWLVHQCNCTTRSAAGLAKQIFGAYPAANTYRDTNWIRVPGTIHMTRGTPQNVINLYGQRKPGRTDSSETTEQRIQWFCAGLDAILRAIDERTIPSDATFCFPRIGCGMAGGEWDAYEPLLRAFATQVPPAATVIVWHFRSDEAGPGRFCAVK